MFQDKIKVEVQTRAGEFYAGLDIDPIIIEKWRPLETHDDPLIAAVIGGITVDSVEYNKVLSMRDGVAKELAAAITDVLIDSMAAYDKHNGYLKNPNDQLANNNNIK